MARYYNTYRMTPAERRARAQQIVQYREERSLLNKYLEEKERAEELMRQQEAERLSTERAEREKNDANFLERGLATVGNLLANAGTGAAKGLEGIADLGLGLLGGIGGIFDDDFEDKVKDIIAKDWTGTYIGEPLQEALRYSYLKDGGIIENVASGVGQMLPAVAVTIATGGAGAGTLAATVAEMASLGVTMAGAAGNATEQAFQEGADYWRGLGYGAMSGAVEGVTEKLLGGATSKIFGAGIFDGVVRSVAGEVAETGARRVIKDAAGEAFEEALAELVNPALKSIYKGRDAFKEYGEADYWKGVGESALVGGLSSVAFGGTVGRAMKTSGKYADISGSLEANDSILEEVRRLSAAGKYTAEAEAQTARVERANLMNIERTLKKSSESERAELISRFKLEAGFEADGSIKESVLKGLEAKENSATARYNRDYVSPELRGKEDVIEDDLRQISERTGVEAKVFAGELSEDAQKNYTKTKKALNALNKKGGNGVTLVITEANSAYKGGLVDDRTLYIPADQLENGDYAGTLVHEFTHFEEGSKAYNTMKSFLQSDELLVDDGEGGKVKLWEAARAKVRAKGYVSDLKELDAIMGKVNDGVELTENEAEIFDLYETELAAHETEIALGNEEFIDRMIAEDGKAAEKLVSRLLSLDKGLSSLKDKQARAQAKLIKEAERLYLKAAESAGNKRIVKMILAQHPELEDELTGMNEEKMQVSEKKVQMSFAGPKAKTADKIRLANAQNMLENGIDSETIRKETGWFKGYDGKWRFEIDDSEMKIIQPYLLLTEKSYTLDQVISHEGLFEAYPQLKDTIVSVQIDGFVSGSGAVGAYLFDKDILALNQAIYLRDEDVKKVIIHEIQHKIQRIEGFARGSSPEYWEKKGISENEYNKFVAATEKELTNIRKGLSEDDRQKLNEYYHLGKKQDELYSKLDFKNIFDEAKNAEMQKILDQITPIEKRHDELYDYLYYQPWFSRYNELYYQTEIGDKLNTVFYKNTAGEIEARNAAERINLSAEERKNTRPDINREDVVFADNSKTAQNFVGWTNDNNEVYVTTSKTMSMSDADRKQKFFNDYANNFRGRTAKFERNGHTHYAKFSDSKNTLGKLVYEGADKSSQSSATGYKAKIRMLADGSLFELVEDTSYEETKPEIGKNKKSHTNAKHWDYYVKTIVVDGKAYDVMVNVRIDVSNNDYSTKQEYVYSIRFRDNKKVATSLVHPATSKATSQFDAATINNSISHPAEKSTENMKKVSGSEKNVQLSLKSSEDTVNISKGELAKIKANYKSDKVFDKNNVTKAINSIEYIAGIRPQLRNELVNRVWKGYNERLDMAGYEKFTEVMYHRIHATILQETSFEMNEADIVKMDEQIAQALVKIVESGKPSEKAKLESAASTEGYRKQAEYWKNEHIQANERRSIEGRIMQLTDKVKNIKKGAYLNASQYKGDDVKVAFDALAKINFRGSLNIRGTRGHIATIYDWYTNEKNLPVIREVNREVADMLQAVSTNKGPISNAELQMIENILKFFVHEGKTHGTIVEAGRRVKAMPKVKEYIGTMKTAKEISDNSGFLRRMENNFFKMTLDPPSLMQLADGYQRGFFTQMHEQLCEGEIKYKTKQLELTQAFRDFWENDKAYQKYYFEKKVECEGVEIPLGHALSLYMTYQRRHAQAGLAYSGFDLLEDGEKRTVYGGVNSSVRDIDYTQEELRLLADEKARTLYEQFSERDKELIKTIEKTFNECRDIKMEIDDLLNGFTNVVLNDYYFPIRRSQIAENVDALVFEGDRVSSLSMNKDTVKGARNALLIEPVHEVFLRHVNATALYHGLGVFTDNFNRLYNMNTTENHNRPITIKSTVESSKDSTKFTTEMMKYLLQMKQNVEGATPKQVAPIYNDVVSYVRGAYAKSQLGANPKVLATQFSSIIAAFNILPPSSIAAGIGVSNKFQDVDKYCSLAWLRNTDNVAFKAQSVSDNIGKVGELLSVPIGKVDRLVVTWLWGACQVEVQNRQGIKVGTVANKEAAGKLLETVILKTQQNALATQRSEAMRSSDELLKGFTMFSADGMKGIGRFFDSIGENRALKGLLRITTDPKEIAAINKRLQEVNKNINRSFASLAGVAVFNALLAYAFKKLYRRDEEETVGTVAADAVGNLIGGMPIIRDIYSFFMDGFEMDNFLLSTFNDVLQTADGSFELVRRAADGEEITRQEAFATLRKVAYAAGQVTGVPVRNIYNFTTGMINRVSPETGYQVDSLFYSQSYRADLARAIECGDEDMIAMIAGIMLDENVGGIADSKSRQELDRLISAGFDVIPRGVADSITYDGEEYVLGASEKKEFKEIYSVANEVLADLVKMSKYKSASDEVKSAAVKYIYKVYWDLALQELVEEDLETKTVLFAEAIPIEKLALIVATASMLKADTDKSGKAVSGSRKKKIQEYVNSLDLKAVEKYMIMGYLGYKNVKGEAQVKAYINKLKLTKSEREKLIAYSGY